MDSRVQLALMSKAKKVFGADDTFLSFPVSPLPYTKRQLDFFAQQDADALRESLHNLQTFSTMVNLIPGDEAWLPTDTRFLWDVYGEVLKEGDFASSTRTPDEEAAYQVGLAYLRKASNGGAWEDSAAVKAYRQHKDAYLLAQQTYQAAKSTAECATDPAEQQRWRDVDEPLQRAGLDALQVKWIVEGLKNEVEAAQSTVVRLGARSPLQTWTEWNSRFNRDIDTLTGAADNFTTFPSFFSPSNALEEGAWNPFKLSEQEVDALLTEAPAELRARFAADGSASVASLTFEFSSATILRPWFAVEALRARFWRFADASRIISDGNTPPRGACPAYVTAVVFARKVIVEEKRAQPGGPAHTPFEGFRFEMAVRGQEQLRRKQQLALGAQQLQYPGRVINVASPAIASPLTMNVRAEDVAMMRRDSVNDGVARPGIAPELAMRPSGLQAMTFIRMAGPSVPITSATIPAPPPPTIRDEPIYILAFICKVLPKCPNPDLTLQW